MQTLALDAPPAPATRSRIRQRMPRRCGWIRAWTVRACARRHAGTWAGFIAMELGAGAVAAARGLYCRCIKRPLEPLGGAAGLAEAWLRMERERGSAGELFEAELRVAPVLAEAAAAAEATANAAAAADAQARTCSSARPRHDACGSCLCSALPPLVYKAQVDASAA